MGLHQWRDRLITPAVAGLLALGVAVRAEGAVIASQNFNSLSDGGTVTTDMLTSGSSLTNSGSQNANPALGMTFNTTWVDTRGNGTGPVTASADTSDFIGVNSFSGSNAPNNSPTGTPVASGSEHNFEFNDGDGRLDLTFDPVDTTGFTSRELDLAYWVAPTGFESDDSLVITLSDGITTETLLSLGEVGLEAVGGGAEGPWVLLNVDIDALGLGPMLTLVVSVDNNSGSENIFVDDIQISGVPEPSTLVLIGLGGLGWLAVGRRRRKGTK